MVFLPRSVTTLLTIFLSIWISPANSQAFCALRDPVKNIYALFTEATSYRSIVHTIDKSTQQTVKETVNFSILQNELGKHTLYIAMKDKTPLGLIHSRSEIGLWGLIEIVWAFDFDLNVIDFKFQRCRERSCRLIEKSTFRDVLKNKSNADFAMMLENKTVPYPENIAHNEEAKALADNILRSAIKTALVTEISWHDELQKLAQ